MGLCGAVFVFCVLRLAFCAETSLPYRLPWPSNADDAISHVSLVGRSDSVEMLCTLRHSQAVLSGYTVCQAGLVLCVAMEHQSLTHDLYIPHSKGVQRRNISILAQPIRGLACESLAPVGVSAAHPSATNQSWMPLNYFRLPPGM